MKTRIGEKSQKAKATGLKGWLKTYPGAAVLIALALVGGVGCAVASMPEAEDEVVLETPPAVETPAEEVKPEEPKEEVVAKTIDETVVAIVEAGAEKANMTATEEGLTVDVVLKAEASEEDVVALDGKVKALLTDAAFVKTNLFEETKEAVEKTYTVNYMVGEEDEEADYVSSAKYASNTGRNGMIYVANAAWAAAEAVEVEEETVETTTPSTTTPSTTTPSTGNNTTGTQQQASQTQNPAQNQTQTQQPTQNQITSTETVENATGSAGSLSAKAKNAKSKINSDVVGWVQIPGTNVDYPVTHTNNNSYYMTHNIYKQTENVWHYDGAIIADYECNFSSGLPTNTILYGHNWTNCRAPFADNNAADNMFAMVHAYADANFAANHPYIYFSTTNNNYKYRVFAAFYTHQNWTDYIYAYPDSTRFTNVLNTAKQHSLHNFGVNVSTSDKIITLSTCTRTYGNGEYRFVVMGKLVG